MAVEADGEERAVLQSVQGQRIVAVTVTKDGMHIDLDDGRTVVIAGTFCAALIRPRDTALH